MAAAVLTVTAVHPAVSVLSPIGLGSGVLGNVLVLGLLIRLVRILALGLSLAAESIYLLSGRLWLLSCRLSHTGLAPSRLRTVLTIIRFYPFIVVHKNSPFTTKLIYRNFFDLLVYVREFTRDL